ncbi:SMI1/KNR4 family protein [Pseudomonas paralcaligenes]|uniref:SMI1/KNR4 family protein n=1 Tax=Pseudomonas paralcaligenes TaxID=2772558 RepID=UPI001C7F1B08|nr:SMI1/KNR4 family protein [Pseudomonas paralcaligenes]
MKITYNQTELPNEFKYPEKYLTEASSCINLYPWVFIDTESDVGKLLYNLGMSEGKKLIPFSSLENGDGDVACFDGSDTSGNPEIIMLVLDGSERAYSFKDFDEWFEMAKNNSSV